VPGKLGQDGDADGGRRKKIVVRILQKERADNSGGRLGTGRGVEGKGAQRMRLGRRSLFPGGRGERGRQGGATCFKQIKDGGLGELEK